jgi:hypothetical protein
MGYYDAMMIKDAGGWKVIYQGQESRSCSLMQQYGVPKIYLWTVPSLE